MIRKSIIVMILTFVSIFGCSKNNEELLTDEEHPRVARKVNEEISPITLDTLGLDELQLNFGEGNGKLLSYYESHEWILITRQFNYNSVWPNENRTVYNNPQSQDTVSTLNSGEPYVITEITYCEPKLKNRDIYDVWACVVLPGNVKGWLNYGQYNKNLLPYVDEEYTLIDEIKTDEYTWNVRLLKGCVTSYGEKVEFRDLPGFNGTHVVSTLVTRREIVEDDGKIHYKYLEPKFKYTKITDEKEKRDTVTEPWVYIEYEDMAGWVYGGDLNIKRGGPKYRTPESVLSFNVLDRGLV